MRWPVPRRWRCSGSSAATACSSRCSARAPGCASGWSAPSASTRRSATSAAAGLFQAIELVADRATKQPFDPALKLHARIKASAMAEGLMVYPMGGTIDGQHGDHVLLAPPFIVDDAQLDLIVQRLARAVDAALAGLR